MDAVVMHSYSSDDKHVFSLKPGDELVILPINEDWCRAKLNGQEAFAPMAYLKVEPHLWYIGKKTREQADQILLEKDINGAYIQPDGAFVIRDNIKTTGLFSISVKCEDATQHYRIYYIDNKFQIWEDGFASFHKLIQHHHTNSINPSKNIVLADFHSPSVYRAKRSFTARDSSELSFKAGDQLKILNSSDVNWWQAEMNNQIGLVPAQFLESNE